MTLLKTILIGLTAGLLPGLVGMGPGLVLVSTLHSILGYEIKKSVGFSLAIIIPVSIIGATSHLFSGHFPNWHWLGLIYCGGLVGIVWGLKLRQIAPTKALEVLFQLFLLLTLLRFWNLLPTLPVEIIPQWWHHILIGLLASLTASLLGVGGGIVIGASYIGILSIPVKTAVLLSLFNLVFSSTVATTLSHKKLLWEPKLTIILISACCGVVSGSLIFKNLQGTTVKTIFSLFILTVFVKMCITRLWPKNKAN